MVPAQIFLEPAKPLEHAAKPLRPDRFEPLQLIEELFHADAPTVEGQVALRRDGSMLPPTGLPVNLDESRPNDLPAIAADPQFQKSGTRLIQLTGRPGQRWLGGGAQRRTPAGDARKCPTDDLWRLAERHQCFDGNGAVPQRGESVRDPFQTRIFALKGCSGDHWPDEEQESPQALRRGAKKMDCRRRLALRPASASERVADQSVGNAPHSR